MTKIRFVGLDVHAETIAVAVAEPREEVRSLGIIPNRLDCVRRLVNRPRTCGKLARLLRSGTHRLRAVLAVDRPRREVRSDCADAGAGEVG